MFIAALPLPRLGPNWPFQTDSICTLTISSWSNTLFWPFQWSSDLTLSKLPNICTKSISVRTSPILEFGSGSFKLNIYRDLEHYDTSKLTLNCIVDPTYKLTLPKFAKYFLMNLKGCCLLLLWHSPELEIIETIQPCQLHCQAKNCIA